MKRVGFTVLIGLVAFASAGLLARSLGKGQQERYAGVRGWTLTQDVKEISTGQEPRLTQRRVEYFAADGRHRTDLFILDDDGKESCQNSTIYDPNFGVFQEDPKNQQLVYIDDKKAGFGDVDADLVRTLPNYVGDQEILGYNCAVFRTTQPGGDVIELYEAYKLGRYPIKRVYRLANAKSIHITEPSEIELGPPSEAEFIRNDNWPITFSMFEAKIQRYSAAAAQAKDPIAAREVDQEANRLRQQMDQAKQRLAAQGHTIK
jgi:hypothetical protein